MNQFAFSDSVRPRKARILRLPLLPYSIGHELILQSERNPLAVLPYTEFLAVPIENQFKSLMDAVLVCYRPYAQFERKHRWLGVWTFSLKDVELINGISAFLEYRALGSTFPRLPDTEAAKIAAKQTGGSESEGRKLGGDVLAGAVNFLTTKYHALGFASVFDVPFGMALHLYFTDLEAQGNLKIENEMERAIKEDLAKGPSDELLAAKKELVEKLRAQGEKVEEL